jgi:hypothetical protein
MAKVHYVKEGDPLCGVLHLDRKNDVRVEVTTNPADVTCKSCLRSKSFPYASSNLAVAKNLINKLK